MTAPAMKLEIGKPYTWKSARVGNVAVHLTGFSPNGLVATFTIDGGEASKQAREFPEMSDGIYFATLGQFVKRPRRTRVAKTVINDIREVETF